MKSTLNNLGSLAVVMLLVAAGVYWFNSRSLNQPPVEIKKVYDAYTSELLNNLEFFSKKIADGNWIFGTRVAALNLQAFRATNDFAYLAQAETAARAYLEHEPNATVYTLLSGIALTKHEFTEARDGAARALEAANTPGEKEQALAARFDAEAALGEIGDMQNTVRALQNVAPQSYSTLTREARLRERVEGDVAKAAALFAQACSLVLETDDIWNRAWCLTQLETFRLHAGAPLDDVQHNLERITHEVYPNFPLALATQGHAAALQHEYTKSEELYRQALQGNDSPDFHLELAELALLRQKPEDAKHAWRQYLNAVGAHRLDTRASGNAIVHVRGLVQALYGLGSQRQAFEEAKADILKRPHDPGAHHTLAFLYLVDHQPEQALRASQRISTTVTLTADEALVRALALHQLNRKDAAEPLFQQVKARDRSISLRAQRVWRERAPET